MNGSRRSWRQICDRTHERRATSLQARDLRNP